jgi:RNA polymerase sigma-70 factor (ECF subfamily)
MGQLQAFQFTFCTERLVSAWDLQDLFRRFGADLLRRASKKVQSSDIAADIIQDTFVRLMTSSPSAELVENQKGYLYRVVDNLAIDYLRRRSLQSNRFVSLDVAQNMPDSLPDAETVLAYRQAIRTLADAIDELPPRCRKVFLLNRFDGLNYREIADQLRISTSMVEKHMMKAIGHCRNRLDGLID